MARGKTRQLYGDSRDRSSSVEPATQARVQQEATRHPGHESGGYELGTGGVGDHILPGRPSARFTTPA